MRFDYALFRREYVRRLGMTSYERANDRADRARQACTPDDWWQDARLWDEPGRGHSTTESEALKRILSACGGGRAVRASIAQDGVRLVQEVRAEMRLEINLTAVMQAVAEATRRTHREQMSLKELREEQRHAKIRLQPPSQKAKRQGVRRAGEIPVVGASRKNSAGVCAEPVV